MIYTLKFENKTVYRRSSINEDRFLSLLHLRTNRVTLLTVTQIISAPTGLI